MNRLTQMVTTPAKTITIMADFGMGPWAWEKDASDETTRVGLNIASSEWIVSRYDVSTSLKKDFSAWVIHFENHYDDAGFDWPEFHRRGIELSRRLKAELGVRVKIVYAKPVEDPNHKTGEQTEIP